MTDMWQQNRGVKINIETMKYSIFDNLNLSILIALIAQLLQILREAGYNDSVRPIHKLVGFIVRM